MNKNPAATDWITTRGEKWRAQLACMEAMLAPVDDSLIQALNLDAPCRIADIGCGGGGTTLEILRQAPAGSVVHGFDLSGVLIESARSRKPPEEHALDFQVADMAVATPPRQLYDRLVSRFGVMFFDDPHAAFSNLVRWLTRGGRFAFAVWDRPEENPWMTSAHKVVSEVIDLPQPDPEAPGAFRYGDADKFLRLLETAGFSDLAVRDWRGALPIGGGLPAAEAADFALASFSSFSELLAEAGNEALHSARQSLTACLAHHEQNGVVRMDACVHVVTGRRLA